VLTPLFPVIFSTSILFVGVVGGLLGIAAASYKVYQSFTGHHEHREVLPGSRPDSRGTHAQLSATLGSKDSAPKNEVEVTTKPVETRSPPAVSLPQIPEMEENVKYRFS
jgi:hypothetical protein